MTTTSNRSDSEPQAVAWAPQPKSRGHDAAATRPPFGAPRPSASPTHVGRFVRPAELRSLDAGDLDAGDLDVVRDEDPRREVDLVQAARAVSDLLDALGVDRDGDGLRETPARVARAYAELLTPEPFEATTFANEEGYDELVVARAIPFSSLCEHHLLPFAGVAHIGYLPGDRLLGLSKLARVVTYFSRRLQVQERLTTQVADWLVDTLHPKGVGVVLEASHACMSLRGVRASGSVTLTSALAGLVRDDERTRAEFFSLVGCRP